MGMPQLVVTAVLVEGLVKVRLPASTGSRDAG
jgi:hypothetical protein